MGICSVAEPLQAGPCIYHSLPFLRAKNFANGLEGSLRKLFSRIYIGVFSSICNLCHNRISANF